MSPAPTASRWAFLPLLAAFAACAGASLWTAQSGRMWDGDVHNAWHHYEYLARGFLKGHTYLDYQPDPGLVALPDPYDPRTPQSLRLWDASLYQGRYYLYFGPAPALFMAGWGALTGQVPPQRLAVAAAAVAELVALALLLWDLRRRALTRVPAWVPAVALIAAFHASWLPVLLRRAAVWELPIAGAVACLAWALYALWKFHACGGQARWSILGGAALALMMACRVTQVFSAGLIALLFLVPRRAGPGRAASALAAGGLALAGGIGLLLYNHARFGAWLEFGQSYQLWGKEYRGMHFFNPAFIPFNAWTYLASLPQLGPYFPFIHPFWPTSIPAGYMSTEDIYGLMVAAPVHLAGLAACLWAWRRRTADPAGGIVLGAATGASLLSAAVLFCWGGACSRYTAELAGGWTLATGAGVLVLLSQDSRRGLRLLTLAASAWTVAFVGLASAEYRGYLRQTCPAAYGTVARFLNGPSSGWARSRGIRFGPLDLAIRVPDGGGAGATVLMASGRPEMLNALLLLRDPSGACRLVLSQNEHHVLETPALAVQAGLLRVRVEAPWLYPPADHPYWDAVADPAARSDRQSLFSLSFGSGSVSIHSTHSADPVAFEPVILTPADAPAGTPCVASATPADPRP